MSRRQSISLVVIKDDVEKRRSANTHDAEESFDDSARTATDASFDDSAVEQKQSSTIDGKEIAKYLKQRRRESNLFSNDGEGLDIIGIQEFVDDNEKAGRNLGKRVSIIQQTVQEEAQKGRFGPSRRRVMPGRGKQMVGTQSAGPPQDWIKRSRNALAEARSNLPRKPGVGVTQLHDESAIELLLGGHTELVQCASEEAFDGQCEHQENTVQLEQIMQVGNEFESPTKPIVEVEEPDLQMAGSAEKFLGALTTKQSCGSVQTTEKDGDRENAISRPYTKESVATGSSNPSPNVAGQLNNAPPVPKDESQYYGQYAAFLRRKMSPGVGESGISSDLKYRGRGMMSSPRGKFEMMPSDNNKSVSPKSFRGSDSSSPEFKGQLTYHERQTYFRNLLHKFAFHHTHKADLARKVGRVVQGLDLDESQKQMLASCFATTHAYLLDESVEDCKFLKCHSGRGGGMLEKGMKDESPCRADGKRPSLQRAFTSPLGGCSLAFSSAMPSPQINSVSPTLRTQPSSGADAKDIGKLLRRELAALEYKTQNIAKTPRAQNGASNRTVSVGSKVEKRLTCASDEEDPLVAFSINEERAMLLKTCRFMEEEVGALWHLIVKEKMRRKKLEKMNCDLPWDHQFDRHMTFAAVLHKETEVAKKRAEVAERIRQLRRAEQNAAPSPDSSTSPARSRKTAADALKAAKSGTRTTKERKPPTKRRASFSEGISQFEGHIRDFELSPKTDYRPLVAADLGKRKGAQILGQVHDPHLYSGLPPTLQGLVVASPRSFSSSSNMIGTRQKRKKTSYDKDDPNRERRRQHLSSYARKVRGDLRDDDAELGFSSGTNLDNDERYDLGNVNDSRGKYGGRAPTTPRRHTAPQSSPRKPVQIDLQTPRNGSRDEKKRSYRGGPVTRRLTSLLNRGAARN